MWRSRVESHGGHGRWPNILGGNIARIVGTRTVGTPTRKDTITSSGVASAVPNSGSTSPADGGVSTAVIVQLLFLALFVVGIISFILQRRRRRMRQRLNQQQTISHISRPIGLDFGPGGNIPPSYQDALKSPVVTASSVYASSHQRQRSDQALMDQCWAAVYQVEDGGSPRRSNHSTIYNDRSEPATPQSLPRTVQRQSVSQWLRDHLSKSGPGAGHGPLSSNPYGAIASVRLPMPPSPSYAGIPATPTASTPQTPMSSVHLTPLYSPYPEPLSARSWATGEDRLSIRASIPISVLYPSPLQPAPPPRRLVQTRRARDSGSSVEEYGAGTWRTVTPHEDPPEYEPRRGNPDTVSPI